MIRFDHFNFNVKNLDESVAFYEKALDLHVVKEKRAEDGSFILKYMGDKETNFFLELTWLKDHPQAYDLGECEFHLALKTDQYEEWHQRHQEMGCIEFENPSMGIYFITDPDGYWIEIVPVR